MAAELKNEKVLFEKKEQQLGIMTLNRPEKLNALNVPLIQEFQEVLDFIVEDDEISVVIITGAGRAFSVGADLDMLHDLGTPEVFRRDLKRLWHMSFGTIEDMEKLFIAALNGWTLGGALELALACDLRVAAEGVLLGLPEIKYGIIPDSGGTNRLAKLVGPAKTKELILSGESITCEEAHRLGLVNKILSSENFLDEVLGYASQFVEKSSVALGLGKIAVNKSLSQDTKSGLEDAMLIQSILLKTSGYQDAIRTFKEKKENKKIK